MLGTVLFVLFVVGGVLLGTSLCDDVAVKGRAVVGCVADICPAGITLAVKDLDNGALRENAL